MKSAFRRFIASTLRALPASTPEFVYTYIFRGPLRPLFNAVVVAILPPLVHIPEGVVVLNPEDPIVSGLLAFDAYEPFETQLFREAVQPGMTIIDIGANIGYYAVLAGRLVGVSGHVAAFEPEPHNFKYLQKTIESNGFKNVSLHQLAIADKKGTLRLHLFDRNKGKHSLVKDSADSKGFSTSIIVDVTTLDSFLQEQGRSHVDIIKMDIEGAEPLALAGMPMALSTCKILFTEFTPDAIRKAGYTPEKVLEELQQKGFILYEIDENSRTKRLIEDLPAFVRTIPSAHAANLVCTKSA